MNKVILEDIFIQVFLIGATTVVALTALVISLMLIKGLIAVASGKEECRSLYYDADKTSKSRSAPPPRG